MQIFVRSPSGRMISLGVYPDETLHSIKQKIMEKHNLVFDGVRMDNDYATLADYNIQHQSMLDLVEKMQIHVKGATTRLDLHCGCRQFRYYRYPVAGISTLTAARQDPRNHS